METVVICSTCAHGNDPDALYCEGCRARLERASRVSASEAERIQRERRAAALRRRIVSWGAAALAALCLASWLAYQAFAPPSWTAPQSSISSAPANGDWPMFQRDPSRAAFSPDAGGLPAGEVVWRFETDAPIFSSPAVSGGRVFLSSGDRRIVALEAGSGETVWEHEVTGPVDSSPAVAGDLVFAGLRDGRLIALDRADGSLRWEYTTGEPVHASPTVHRGVVYIGSGDRRLHALDAVSGKARWTYETEGRVLRGAAVGDEVAALNSQDRLVHLLDIETGRYRLAVPARDTNGSPAMDGDHVYIAETTGALLAVDWKQRHLPLERFARWARTTLFIWGLVDTLPPPKGFVWRFVKRGEAFEGVPAIGPNAVYIGSRTGRVFAVNRANGEQVWAFQSDAEITTSPSVVGQTLYVGDKDGALHGIDTQSGEPRWRIQLDGEVASTVVYANGTIFATTKSGTLYAVR